MSEATFGAGFSTMAIHAGAQPDPTTGSRVASIHQTTSYAFDDADHALPPLLLQALGNGHSRVANPTCAVLEERVAALEGGTAALAVASGQAARMLAFHTLLQPGDELVAAHRPAGGSVGRLDHAGRSFGWTVRWADAAKPESFVEALSDRTKAIFLESIAEPGGAVTDIEGIAAIARRARVPLVVDNTLATPYLVRPFEHGADIVVHAATKFLCGHATALGGLIVDGGSFSFAGDPRYPALSQPSPCHGGLVIGETFGNFAFAVAARGLGLSDIGAALSPFNAFLILTGIETLALRMQRHCDNALAVARHLESHPKVDRVRYAGLEGDSGHALAQRYCPKGAGAAFAFGVGSHAAALALVSRLKLFSPAAAVGDTRSLIVHPAFPHHQAAGDAARAGGPDADLVCVSIGLEDAADIIADLDQALAG